MAWKNIQLAISSDIDVNDRIRFVESLPLSDVIHRSATALLYNYEYNTGFPSDWKDVYFKRIEKALNAASEAEDKIKPLVEAARMAVLLRNSNSSKYLHDLEELLPDYAWTYYLQARISYANADYVNSLELLRRAIDCAIKSPGLLQEFVLPVIERGNSCDGRRITDFMWQPVVNHGNEFQVSAMLHLAFELRGKAFQRINDIPKAINAYCEAIDQTPVPSCLYRLSPLLIDQREFERLSDSTDKGIRNSPYDSILILYNVYALINLGQKYKAFKKLSDHRSALKCFEGVRKTSYIKNSLILIMASLLSGTRLSSMFIEKFIKILKKKSVNFTSE
jgi:tetratricopeptide (TPR) repeat protein